MYKPRLQYILIGIFTFCCISLTSGSQSAEIVDDLKNTLSEDQFPEDTVFSPEKLVENQNGNDFIALPNPLRNRDKSVMLMCRTKCVGNALVNVYDAVGTMLFSKVVKLQQPDAVGYKMCIPWNCRNQQGRLVGKGTYLAVVRIFDINNRLVARRTAHIGIAYQ